MDSLEHTVFLDLIEPQNMRIDIIVNAEDSYISIRNNSDSENYCQDGALAELDMFIGNLKGTTKYKALNTIGTLNNTEKKILEHVINIIETLEIDNADIVIEAILNNFSTE